MLPDVATKLDIVATGLTGRVVDMTSSAITAAGMPAPIGAVVQIERAHAAPVEAEVIGFHGEHTVCYPLGELSGLRRGSRVRLSRTRQLLGVSRDLLGRVIDARGRVIDQGPQPLAEDCLPLHRPAPPAVERPPIDAALSTGVRAIDGMLTCGCGQRMGVFSGSGVGKSVTMGMMARYTSADVNVIALIGERGREVNEFLQRDLGEEGLRRSVVVVATSDEPAVLRVQAALAATSVAEYFRDRGQHVLLLMDSLTRFALAQREIGLAAGEPPTTRGFPPSVFSIMPRILERAGRTTHGSITAFYTVLVEGDDTNEPISDAARGLLDGHTVLSRKLAGQGHYPAIDILQSLSRLQREVTTPEHVAAAQRLRALLGAYRDHEELISIGAYRAGSNPSVDQALSVLPQIQAFLTQAVEQRSSVEEARRQLRALLTGVAKQPAAAPPAAVTTNR